MSRTQVDRLGDRLKHDQVEADLRLLDQYRRSFREAHDTVVSTIVQQLALEPTSRPAKSNAAIIDKLHRESIRMSQMQDIAGCRLVVSDIVQQDRVVAAVCACFEGAEVIDRRKRPSHGYRAAHVVVRPSGKIIEIQIRSRLQHLWAELSEKFADVFGSSLKYGGGDAELRAILLTLSHMVAREEEAEGLWLSCGDDGEGVNERRRAIVRLLKDMAFFVVRSQRNGETR